jgi:hypothetical protein
MKVVDDLLPPLGLLLHYVVRCMLYMITRMDCAL